MIKNQIQHQRQKVQDHQSTQANLGSPAYHQNHHQGKEQSKRS